MNMGQYSNWVTHRPIVSSMVQVGVIATLGQYAARSISSGSLSINIWQLLLYAVVWAFLGITFKCAFIFFPAGTRALDEYGLCPWIPIKEGRWQKLLFAFTASAYMQACFGVVFILFHQWTNYIIDSHFEQAVFVLPIVPWLWLFLFLFAHTLMFLAPEKYRVGIAAVLTLAIGAIMAAFK